MESQKTSNKTMLLIAAFAVVATLLFWFAANNSDVYADAFTGALFEIAWLPFVMITLALPLFCLFFWYKERFSVKSGFLYMALLSMINIGMLVTH